MRYFETHAHYNDERFDNIVDETLKECESAGVKYIINIGFNKESSIKAIELSKDKSNIFSAIGVHPHDVENDTAKDIEDIYNSYDDRKILAIGEIGLDYAFVKDNKDKQIDLFKDQIRLANKLKLPIIVHSRDASLDTCNVLKEVPAQYGTLMHCFQPSDDLVNLIIENGYMVAFGGNITYKRAESFKKYINMIPIEQILIETDSPYLPPEPYRGKINTSKYLPIILKKLAEYKGIDEKVASEIIFTNSLRFFKIKE